MNENKILYENKIFFVINEGSKNKPNYHVFKNQNCYSIVDSAYSDLSLAVCRCDYLAKRN